ncbi:TIGR00282 family metallophosphoesterase [Pseudobacteriovorax antillogorgiicola]|uniref:Capsule synthesis protein CapA domain-containing protein n=1 Tax=Pseudobacteriovorax antillogorgiicola TaxID=1513793 RepID=A0A1Y6B3U7_9BACT|nr:TIGR00282 family metallophosphoesterase [Pseudobacteriovorax antillogorgiicola]TCS59236.1 hypothetical protein EDD56_101139 [Pseudobacteriovorax antillogorgiicola]SME90279.1 hypothetical protein SAMN06296036_101347 [Pseudobacteriovorax antillogorgiicola]
MIKLIAIGDVMGKAGRRCLAKALPKIQELHAPDILIVNGENAAGGFGITKKIYKQLIESFGVDCVTTGNHWHDKREIYELIPSAERLVIPGNMMNVDSIHHGYKILETKSGTPFAVINVIGSAFMHPDNRNPFHCVDEIMKHIPEQVRIRVVDVHAEATSEKQGMGRYLAEKASLVFGTHSHVPTADERILDNYTGFITDIGMTGPYDSVIGIRKEAAIARMTGGERKKFEPATKDLWMPFVAAEIDEQSGACLKIERFRWELERMDLEINDSPLD